MLAQSKKIFQCKATESYPLMADFLLLENFFSDTMELTMIMV